MEPAGSQVVPNSHPESAGLTGLFLFLFSQLFRSWKASPTDLASPTDPGFPTGRSLRAATPPQAAPMLRRGTGSQAEPSLRLELTPLSAVKLRSLPEQTSEQRPEQISQHGTISGSWMVFLSGTTSLPVMVLRLRMASPPEKASLPETASRSWMAFPPGMVSPPGTASPPGMTLKPWQVWQLSELQPFLAC